MKLSKLITGSSILMLAMLAVPLWSEAEEQWHYQASLEAPEAGLLEAVLPAGLYFNADAASSDPALDLSLIGPDGNPRSFELYWKDDTGPRTVVLKASRLRLDRNRALLWESDAPKDLLLETIRIDMAAAPTIGTVTIEGRDARGWSVLAANAALYDAGSRSAPEIRIKPAVYEQLRLSFRGYDKKFRETPFPVRSVVLSGKSAARDYVEKTVGLRFSDRQEEDKRVLSSTLPGLGLWIKTLTLSTEAQFQGTWELGQDVVIGGRQQFQTVLSGSVTTVGNKGSTFEIPVNDRWRSRSLVLRLSTGGKYLGAVKALWITVNLPRMAFYADKAGTYLARTGSGARLSIQQTPGDKERKIGRAVAPSEVSENPQWAPEELAEKYAVAGGPFDEKGYRWKAGVRITGSGYYRLVLNRDASLAAHSERIRLVRDTVQVPYFPGPSEEQRISLAPKAEYDKKKNRTTWSITLPERSGDLTELSMESQGIFDRVVSLELPKEGRSGWRTWKTVRWQNAANGPSVMRLSLAGLPRDINTMRISMDHGDNRPIDIRAVETGYYAPTLLFLIHQPGEYALFGGNENVAEARYDLALVRAHLVNAMPKSAVMEDVKRIRYAGVNSSIVEAFDDRSWGLYAVLGAVTLVLMLLIVKLFPKEEQG